MAREVKLTKAGYERLMQQLERERERLERELERSRMRAKAEVAAAEAANRARQLAPGMALPAELEQFLAQPQ